MHSVYNIHDGKGHKIPKGPRGFPFLGSFPFLTAYPELTLTYWQRKFGPIYSMWLGKQLVIVVSDPGIAKDFLVTNGLVFSSRKEMFIKSQIVFAGRGITASPYNDRWRTHRRIAAGMLNATALEVFTPVFDRESVVLVQSLYSHGAAGSLPVNPQVRVTSTTQTALVTVSHAGRCSLNNMLAIVFATRTETIDDPLVGEALRLSREFMNCTGPVSNLIDFVEVLQTVPTPMRSRAKRLHADLVLKYGSMISDIGQQLERGDAVPDCLAKTMIQSREEEGLDWTDMCMLASAFMIGGVETTAAIMQWFAALIPALPHIQERAHEELDRVIGRDRLPTVHDEPYLPYIRAIIKEVERTRNPFWLGTPHFSTADFTTNAGHFIPKGTVVMLNTYGMHHDPTRYPDPHVFNPDRYLDHVYSTSDSANLPDPYERDHWMFGAGRRICPGIMVAEREIWLTISRMLWCFRMEQIPGEPIDLKEYDGKSGRSPVPFRIRCIPRHENVAKVLGFAA
ncbi:cytochrome P450 [Exidia glandulosa HHB12029]|uniref:Cytochrome P450 n=1 Tax=Exidia glandulosa HHB12029 TaxID=1314781 RepID=A0A165MB27_EXIGL|nr:cytochrome P450 [Exidia glandulosa HHB12029]